MPALVTALRKLALVAGSACAGTATPSEDATATTTSRRRITPSSLTPNRFGSMLTRRLTGRRCRAGGRRRLFGALEELRTVGARCNRGELGGPSRVQARILP